MKLFSTSGIRGSAETFFSNQFCTQLGIVFGKWLKSHHKEGDVAVAYDPRSSSPRIKDHFLIGLSQEGFEVLDQGVIPAPALAYFVRQNPHLSAGVMITGSHIQSDLNGIKFFLGNGEILKSHEAEIESLFIHNTFIADRLYEIRDTPPIVKNESTAKDLYIDMLVGLASLPYPKWEITVDTANGTQSEIIRPLFDRLGLTLRMTGDCDIQSPYFVPRDTEVQTSTVDLQKQVISTKSDLGVAFDVDGDRVVFVDEKGRFIPGDYSCTLLAQVEESESIVTTVSTSSVIDSIGKRVYRTAVGSPIVSAKMLEIGASFGFEPNGGSISGDLHYSRDGGATFIKLLNLLKNSGKSLAQLVDALPRYHMYKDKLDCPQDSYAKIYTTLSEKYQGKDQDKTDGLKVFLNSTDWILFRGSGNAPEFRVIVQSDSESKSHDLGLKSIEFIKSLIHDTKYVIHDTVQDSLHVLDSIRLFPDQCAQVLRDQGSFKVPSMCSLVDNIVISGMGGSALGGRIIDSLSKHILKVPLSISTQYSLPAFVGPKTLVVASSYSGDTQETIESLQEALVKKAQVFAITTGGKLAELAGRHSFPVYLVDPIHNPSGQPRLGLGYNIMSILALLGRCGHIQLGQSIDTLPDYLRKHQNEDQALEIAGRLVGKIPLLISGEHLTGSSHAIKNMVNENSKHFVASFDLPESNHHLLEGLQFPSSNPKNLVAVFVNSAFYHPDLGKTIQATKSVFQKNHIETIDLQFDSPNPLTESLEYLQAGAFISYFLASLNGVDPGPIPYVHWYKENTA